MWSPIKGRHDPRWLILHNDEGNSTTRPLIWQGSLSPLICQYLNKIEKSFIIKIQYKNCIFWIYCTCSTVHTCTHNISIKCETKGICVINIRLSISIYAHEISVLAWLFRRARLRWQGCVFGVWGVGMGWD